MSPSPVASRPMQHVADPQRRQSARGMLLVLMPAVLVGLLALAMLTADWGHVQLVRAELQGAADAAALAGAAGIGDGTAIIRAREAAQDNIVDGRPIDASGDAALLGTWNPQDRTFTPGGGSPDAIEVTLRASVPLFFGHLMGLPEVNLAASAVGLQSGGPPLSGLIGLDSLRFNSHAHITSFDSGDGFWSSGNIGSEAVGASNGPINVNSQATFAGDLHHLPGQDVSINGNAEVGGQEEMPGPLTFGSPSLPASYINRGSWTQSGGALVLNSGTYLYEDLVINAGAELVVTGSVTLYVSGQFVVNSHSSADGHLPSQLRIVALSGAEVHLHSHAHLSAQVHAPDSDVVLNSHSTFAGSVVGKNLLVNSYARVHVDTAAVGESLTGNGRLVR